MANTYHQICLISKQYLRQSSEYCTDDVQKCHVIFGKRSDHSVFYGLALFKYNKTSPMMYRLIYIQINACNIIAGMYLCITKSEYYSECDRKVNCLKMENRQKHEL